MTGNYDLLSGQIADGFFLSLFCGLNVPDRVS